MGILDRFGWSGDGRAAREGGDAAETDTVRKIAQALDRLDPDRARYIAAFAYVLSRVARADLNISESETAEMERIVREKGGLPEAQAVMIVQMAKAQNVLFGGVENFLVTREFDRIATREQKLALLHCLFAVAKADRSVSSAEDTTIRKIASELHLDHADFVAVKSAYRDFLAVHRDPEPPPSES